MALTSNNETRQTADVVVSIRAPSGAAGDLTTVAERRLNQITGVSETPITSLRGLEPGLSATIVTVDVTLNTTGESSIQAVHDEIAATPVVETLDATHQ